MGDPLMVALFWVAFPTSTSRWQQLVAAEGAESDADDKLFSAWTVM